MERHLHLYCLPYAGASAVAVYSKWKKYLSSDIHIHPIELSGHGSRALEPLNNSVEEMVDGILKDIRSNITSTPYAIYGHSMGTLISYELLKRIKGEGLPLPKVWFISGRYPAHILYDKVDMSTLPDDVFLKKIMQLGGTPQELFLSKELLLFFLPILRNDYKIVEEYVFDGLIESFDCDIEFFYSDNDYYIKQISKIFEWKLYSNKCFHVHYFTGGHFFINESMDYICKIIQDKLKQYK